MSTAIELVVRIVVIGCGATLVMDLWAAGLRRLGVPSLDLALLGRWVLHLRRGRWFHESIARTTPVRGERLIGWCAHYAIGIGFAALLLATFGLAWARSPTLQPALFIGLVPPCPHGSSYSPALGAGIASSKTPRLSQLLQESGHSHRVRRRALLAAHATVLSFATRRNVVMKP